jgi:hypothetical protein
MQLNTRYAFSKENLIGQARGSVQTPLVEGSTVKGEPVVTLCEADSFVPRKDGAALVVRGQEGEWQPVASMKQLQEAIATTPKENLGEQLGIWTDSRFLLVAPKDGVPQEREVQPLQSHWQENTQSEAIRYTDLGVRNGDPNAAPQPMVVGWSLTDANVRASAVSVLPAAFPGKQVGVLSEPLFVDSHEIIRVTEFNDSGYGFTPTAVESTLHTEGAASQVTPDAGYDLAPLLYDRMADQNVIPV